MKIIGLLNPNNMYNISLFDEVIIPTIYSIYYEYAYSKDEIIELINTCNNINIKPILEVDALLSENDVKLVYNLLDELKGMKFDVMFSDISILSYFKDEKNRLVYNAPTYICNKMDIEYYKNLNVRVMLSNELSLDDCITNCKYDNVILQVYGNYPIYYSKRRVVSLFKEHSSLDFDSLKCLEMKEETREERYIVKEYENIPHTTILNAKKICIFKELDKINPSYIFVNTNNTDVIKMYKEGSFTSIDEEVLIDIDERVDKSLLYSNPSILNQNEKN